MILSIQFLCFFVLFYEETKYNFFKIFYAFKCFIQKPNPNVFRYFRLLMCFITLYPFLLIDYHKKQLNKITNENVERSGRKNTNKQKSLPPPPPLPPIINPPIINPPKTKITTTPTTFAHQLLIGTNTNK